MGEEAIKYCKSYATQAEIRLGEMLTATERAKGTQLHGKDKFGGHIVLPPKETPTYAELGITKRESSEAQMLAATERAKGTRPSKKDGGHMELPPSNEPTLSELGITTPETIRTLS
jgi:hypothetical protein